MLYCRYRLSANLKFYTRCLTGFLTGKHRHNKQVPLLNQQLQKRFNVQNVFAINQARLGLYLYLKEILTPGDEVLISSYTLIDMVNMIICAGGIPVFVDTESDSFFMDQTDLKLKITAKSKVIVVTTLYGIIEDISFIKELAKEKNILLFEDCAQGFGTKDGLVYGGLRGDAGVFSFGALKNVNGLFGGALFVKDGDVFKNIMKKNNALPLFSAKLLWKKFLFCLFYEALTHPLIYTPFKNKIMDMFDELGHVDKDAQKKTVLPKQNLVQMTSLQADLIINSLKVFDGYNLLSQKLAHSLLSQVQSLSYGHKTQLEDNHYTHSYLQFPVVFKQENTTVKSYMRDQGIDVNTDFFRDLNSLDCFYEYKTDCSKVKNMIKHLVLYPTYARQSESYNNLVGREIKKWASKS